MTRSLANFASALASCVCMNTGASEASSTEGKRVPAEWEPQESTWLQWPGPYGRVYESIFASMSVIISRYQKLKILVNFQSGENLARKVIAASTRERISQYSPGRDVYDFEMLAPWHHGGGVHCHTNDQPVLL